LKATKLKQFEKRENVSFLRPQTKFKFNLSYHTDKKYFSFLKNTCVNMERKFSAKKLIAGIFYCPKFSLIDPFISIFKNYFFQAPYISVIPLPSQKSLF